MIYDAMNVVVVPFPFSDKSNARRRPAVILTPYETFGKQTDVAHILMITAAKNSAWPHDVPVTDLSCSGLHKSCVVRMKLATMSFARIEKNIGKLSDDDQSSVRIALGKLYGMK